MHEPKPSLAALCRRSTRRALATIAAEYAIVAAAVALGLAFDSIPATIAVILVIGTRQYALGECMAHEASHRNLSRVHWINEALGMLLTWPFLVTLGGYRRFHNRLHHAVPLSDDDNSIYEDYEDWGLPLDGTPLTPFAAVWHMIVKPLIGVIALRHAMKTVQDFYWDGDLVENTLMLVTWAAMLTVFAYAGVLEPFLIYWMVPWLLVMPVLNYWSEVGDHYRVDGAETRSNLSRWLNTLIAHNIGYHALHHRYPSIPWFRLPEAYALYRHELQEQVSDGYFTTFRQILAAGQQKA